MLSTSLSDSQLLVNLTYHLFLRKKETIKTENTKNGLNSIIN
jgi:hypothetical protein